MLVWLEGGETGAAVAGDHLIRQESRRKKLL